MSGRRNVGADDPARVPDSDEAHWRYTVGLDSNYGGWSVGMRGAAEDGDLRVEEESSEEEEESYNEF